MDYVVGSVAALVSGNVTPSRPRIMKRALTPTKHQPSPNVTPKSEFVDDRSIFLSPSVQKKKAIVKKSPKRIFQNPDLETTGSGEDNPSLTSPKADKVKKHLKDDLDSDMGCNKNTIDAKSPKNKGKNKKDSVTCTDESNYSVNTTQSSNENTPTKKKKKNKNASKDVKETERTESAVIDSSSNFVKSPKKMKQRRQSVIDDESNKENATNDLVKDTKISNNNNTTKQKSLSTKMEGTEGSANAAEATEDTSNVTTKKKNKKRKKKSKQVTVEKCESTETIAENKTDENGENNQSNAKRKNRKRKKSIANQGKPELMEVDQPALENEYNEQSTELIKKSKTIVNPNAITDKESDSEHESDDEIESENEEINKQVYASEQVAEESSDDEEEKVKEGQPPKPKVENKDKDVKNKGEVNTEDEIKRTLFVGNVPFSAKCKKEIKKIFNKHGQIETIRIRTVPVKDGRYTPKLAVIKNELHPERTTVNVYIKYADEESVQKALAENNTVLNDHHLRVSQSSCTGAEHDPKCSIFLGNLPFAIEDETLRQKFEKCGEIESVRIIRDKKTNAGKGFGYVNFASKDAVELALALTEEDLTIKNRIIRVKRCTQLTNKQKKPSDKGGFNKSPYQRPNQGNQRVQTGQRPHQGNQRFQTGHRPNQGNQRFQNGERQHQGNQRWNQGFQRENQGGQRYGTKDEAGREGAHRRVMQKRKSQDANSGDGPPNKRPKNINQPNKEKKTRKEFVGMTAEKKKKRKFDKGQKKKKALSEILTK